MKDLIEIVARLSGMMVQMEESARVQFNLQNLTHNQLNYLEAISRLGNPNITELSAELRLTKPTVKVAIDKLIAQSYVFKVKSDADRRSAHLHLTDQGKMVNQMHEYAHRRIAEVLANAMSKEEVDGFVRLMSRALH